MYTYIGKQVTGSSAITNNERIIAGNRIHDVGRKSSFDQEVYFPPVHGFFAGDQGFIDFIVEPDYIKIEYLTAEPEFRDQGIEAGLLAALEQRAKELRKRQINAVVGVSNQRLINTLEQNGYLREQIDRNFYRLTKDLTTNTKISGLETVALTTSQS